MISQSVLTKKCSIQGELVPFEPEKKIPEPEPEPESDSEPELEPEAPEAEPELEPEAPMILPVPVSIPNQKCPCIIKATKQPCGRPIKEFGVCGIHKNKCVEADGNVLLPNKPRVQAVPVPIPVPVVDVQNATCPCVIVTRQGEKKICGRPIKEFGVCGLHKNKCVGPDGVIVKPAGAEAIKSIPRRRRVPAAIVEEAEPEPPELPEPIVEVQPKIIQPIGTCPCIIKGKKGQQDRICGAKIKNDGKCGRHQRTCHMPVPAPEPTPVLVPLPAPASPDVMEDLAQELEDEFDIEEDDPVEIEISDAEEQLRTPVEVKEREEPVVELATQDDWKFAKVDSIEQVYDYLVNVPDVDIGEQVILTDHILTYLRE